MEYLEKERARKTKLNKQLLLFISGTLFILTGIGILGVIYTPLFKSEIIYRLSSQGKGVVVAGADEKIDEKTENSDSQKIIHPVDEDFGLVIPKISANSKVIADVDPDNSAFYQRALTKGVAHARGTAYPGQDGNIFIFAHSGVDLPEALRYNAVFYLLRELEPGDEAFIFYKGQKFRYVVKEKKIVNAEESSYMENNPGRKTLTLMTCWPPGTTFKRLVVIADQQ
jgi:LPXTG-site transpeptidase (sortase) family protein